ncbi:cell envelope integrity protein TolA [Gallaecimonas pentaromativorans]|uniref:cell envelope integrity protein TolA n=1 Tax=Gallaecimonas pentaromativorans TaxID=584787 RepID=UPI00067EDC3C|nr:cell envelope integrity protein TolA [Gallaecimonas pentaromativorans]MED5524417.1 cell envelope integrity protein TolA [Pseudomonadota bacterium]
MRNEGMGLPAGLSIGLHALILALLGLSLDFSKTPEMPQPQGEPITAKAVDSAVVEQQVKRIKAAQAAERKAEVDRQQKLEAERQAEQQRIAQLKQQRAQEEQARVEAQKQAQEAKRIQQQEQQKAKELEIARQKKLEEKKQADAAAKAAEEKRQKEEAAAKAAEEKRKKEEAERKRKEEEARKKVEAEKKRQAEEAKRKAEQEKLLADQMAQEAAQRSAARQKQVLSELQKYQALIKDAIDRNVIRDDSMRGKEAKVAVQLAPSGLVLDVRYLSGDKALYDAVQRALWKIQTLPVSKDPDVFAQMKNLNITYRPEF